MTHVLVTKVELGPVLLREVSLKDDASRHILENREPFQQYHALINVLRQWRLVCPNELVSLTKVKTKAVVQPKKSTHSEDITHGGGGTRGLAQLDTLLLCNRVFQLPPDLKCAGVQPSIHDLPHSHLP